jgi:hypothetical protein
LMLKIGVPHSVGHQLRLTCMVCQLIEGLCLASQSVPSMRSCVLVFVTSRSICLSWCSPAFVVRRRVCCVLCVIGPLALGVPSMLRMGNGGERCCVGRWCQEMVHGWIRDPSAPLSCRAETSIFPTIPMSWALKTINGFCAAWPVIFDLIVGVLHAGTVIYSDDTRVNDVAIERFKNPGGR